MKKYSIQVPPDVQRTSSGKRTTFITKQRYEALELSREYRDEMSKARKNTHSILGGESRHAALRLALSFLAPVAAKENGDLEIRCERKWAGEKAEENLMKCKRDIMEVLDTFLYECTHNKSRNATVEASSSSDRL